MPPKYEVWSRNKILYNRRITTRKLADDVGISLGSSQASFTDASGMKRAAAKIVPKLLNFEQKLSLIKLSHLRRDVEEAQPRSRFA